MNDPYVVSRWTGLQSVIDSINHTADKESAVASLTMILLSKVDLNISEMSDAIQSGFLTFEGLTKAERSNLSDMFDSHLISLKN